MVRLHGAELTALALLAISTLLTLVGPFYYNSVVRHGGERVFYVTARQWVFEPNEFVVKQGEKVTFIVTSEDVTHGFQIIGYGVNVVVNPGDYVKITFVADKAGVFEIRCSVYCGEPSPYSGAGHWLMKGALVVTS